MRKYAGSCGIAAAWRKRRRETDGRIPRYLLTILEQGDAIEDTLLKMEQVMPKYCELCQFAAEELQSPGILAG